MLRVVELTAWALLLVCAALLFAIQAVRFCFGIAVTALLLVCCIGGALLWAAGG